MGKFMESHNLTSYLPMHFPVLKHSEFWDTQLDTSNAVRIFPITMTMMMLSISMISMLPVIIAPPMQPIICKGILIRPLFVIKVIKFFIIKMNTMATTTSISSSSIYKRYNLR